MIYLSSYFDSIQFFPCTPPLRVYNPVWLLSPFDLEMAAYSTILADEEAKNKMPVVPAYGWIQAPDGFSVRSELVDKVIVKVS